MLFNSINEIQLCPLFGWYSYMMFFSPFWTKPPAAGQPVHFGVLLTVELSKTMQWGKVCMKKKYVKLLTRYSHRMTLSDQGWFFFSKRLHCNNTHRPITVAVRDTRHVRLPRQQHQQPQLASSFSVPVSTKQCWENNIQTLKTTILKKNIRQSVTDHLGKLRSCFSVLLDKTLASVLPTS